MTARAYPIAPGRWRVRDRSERVPVLDGFQWGDRLSCRLECCIEQGDRTDPLATAIVDAALRSARRVR